MAQFEQLRTLLLGDAGEVDAQRLVRVARAAISHSEHAAVTVVRGPRAARTVASTDDLCSNVDSLQYESGEGPCLDATAGDDLVVTADLAAEPRWPTFGPRCASSLGVRSILSVRLALANHDHGALSFYSSSADAFDDLDVGTASIMAPFATLAIQQHLHQTDVANLTEAIGSRGQIGVAIGILMARYQVSNDDAFQMLRTASMNLNRKPHDIALDVADTGAIPKHLPGRGPSPALAPAPGLRRPGDRRNNSIRHGRTIKGALS